MIGRVVISVFVVLLLLGAGTIGWTADDDGSRLTIVSPVQGAVIKGDSVQVRYKLPKGAEATHIHCYVDGEYQKGFSGEIKNLSRGTHKVTITGATKDHDPVTATHSVTVDVQ